MSESLEKCHKRIEPKKGMGQSQFRKREMEKRLGEKAKNIGQGLDQDHNENWDRGLNF